MDELRYRKRKREREFQERLERRAAEEEAKKKAASAAVAAAAGDDSSTTEVVRKPAPKNPEKKQPKTTWKDLLLTNNEEENGKNAGAAAAAGRKESYFPPKSVGHPLMKASPSSSVSMSQSPEKMDSVAQKPNNNNSKKPAPRRPRKRTGLLADSSSSSEEEDLVDYARRMGLARQEKQQPANTQNNSNKKTVNVAAAQPPKKSAGSNNNRSKGRSLLDDESDDNGNDGDHHDDKEPKPKSNNGGAATAPAAVAKPKSSKPAKKPRRGFALLDDSSSEEEVDLAQAARDFERGLAQREQEAAKLDESDRSEDEEEDKKPAARTAPRNPLALMRQQDASARVNAQPSPVYQEDGKNDLWSDSEEAPTPASSEEFESADKIKLMIEKNKKKQRRIEMDGRKRDREMSKAMAPKIRDVPQDEIDKMKRQPMPEFANPKFGPFEFEPLMLGGGANTSGGNGEVAGCQVPASIARYLKAFQKEGISFMYNKAIVPKRGVILGDDMGLGKTVQSIALIAALLGKRGTGEDLLILSRREKLVEMRKSKLDMARNRALADGRIALDLGGGAGDMNKDLNLPDWSPIMIIAPNSVTSHWIRDLKTWGHFSVALYQGPRREAALESVNDGLAEVVVCGLSMLAMEKDADKLVQSKQWRLIIVDELHKLKNEKAIATTNLRKLRDAHNCVIIGLTGTAMQNRHKELWNAVDMVAKDYLGPWHDFEYEFGKPIQLARSIEATEEAVEIGSRKTTEFMRMLNEVYLRRTKEGVLLDDLPTKEERIVFCEPSQLQKELYQHIISQPDFVLLAQANAPCDCGVNKKFFLEFQHKRSKEERIAYQRENRWKITKRSDCCHPIPLIYPADGSPPKVDPGAICWNQKHETGNQCEKCPFCICFTLLHILYKLSSHAALLQVRQGPGIFGAGSKQRKKAEEQLERAKFFIPEHLVSQLPGGYVQDSGFMNDHFSLSGKMVVLDRLLAAIQKQRGRALLFSPSTQVLDLIQNYLMAKGTSFLRMDGTTSNQQRDEIAAEFRKRADILVFLLSTTAMGVGLTITEANFVIIFDVDWNPANDAQAQDRAFRIGQTKNVKVFRLVSTGTIEELKYLRQVYKTQLQKETIVDLEDTDRAKSKRLFRGVEGDKSRKGELFGIENLLKFKDGHFMNYASKVAESKQYGVGVHGAEDLLEQVKDMDEEELADIGADGNIFSDLAQATEKVTGSDVDGDEENEFDDSNVGGMSQTMLDMCDRVEVHEEDDEAAAQGEQAQDVLSPIQEERALDLEALRETENRSGVAQVSRVSNAGPEVVLSRPDAAESTRKIPEISKKEGEDDARARELDTRDSSVAVLMSPLGVEKAPSSNHKEEEANMKDRKSDYPDAGSDTEAIETQSPVPVSKAVTAVTEPSSNTAPGLHKKAGPRNVGIVGQTSSKIRNGEAGRTAFSALDLPLPGGSSKKKNKK